MTDVATRTTVPLTKEMMPAVAKGLLGSLSVGRCLGAYAAAILACWGVFEFASEWVRIGGHPHSPTFAEFSATVQNSLYLTTLVWAAAFPLILHGTARALGGKGDFQGSVKAGALAGMSGLLAWVPATFLYLRGNLLGGVFLFAVQFLLLPSLSLGTYHHALIGWRKNVVLAVGVGLAFLLPPLWSLIPVLAAGIPRELQRKLDRAAILATHRHDLAPQDNAAVAYKVAGAEDPPSVKWFLEGSKRKYADFMPDMKRMTKRNAPHLPGEFAAAYAMIDKADRLRQDRKYRESAEHFIAVLAFIRHLGRQENHALGFQISRNYVIGRVFTPLSNLVTDRGLPDAQARALAQAVFAAHQSRERYAWAVSQEFHLDHAVRSAYLRQRLDRFFAPGPGRDPAGDLEALLRDDVEAVRLGILRNDSEPIARREAERKKLIAAAYSGDSKPSAIGCVWDIERLAACAYAQQPSMDPKRFPEFGTLAETRLLLLETALGIRLEPGQARNLPRDPWAPEAELKLLDFGHERLLYSIGPDRIDQGGAPRVYADKDLDGTPPGDLAISILNPWPRPLPAQPQ